MFRLRIALALFVAWFIMLLLTIEANSAVFEIMMPIIMGLLALYLFICSIFAIFDNHEKDT
jgi:hypothetical protein